MSNEELLKSPIVDPEESKPMRTPKRKTKTRRAPQVTKPRTEDAQKH
jgi:hypothetical protein